VEGDSLIDSEFLLKVAKNKGLKNREHIEKDYFQDVLLYHLYKKSNNFIFKGGTCLYKLYNLPRFSEDLDFSILTQKNIKETIESVARELKAKIESKKTKTSFLFKLRFSGILTQFNIVRIDVSLFNIVFGFEVKNYVSPYVDIPPFSLRVLKLEEMLAEKIHALIKRNNARDLYDLFFLLRFVVPNEELIQKKLEIFKMKFDKEIVKRKIEEIKPKWEAELKPFLLTEVTDFEVAEEFVKRKLGIE
jgi:predicted nucleotidyltransferase component of viral defense system